MSKIMSGITKKVEGKKIKDKLGFLVKFSVILMVIMGIVAGMGAFLLESKTRELSNDWMVANNIIAELDYLTSEYRLKQYHHVVNSDKSYFATIEQEIEDINAQIEVLLVQYQDTIVSEEDQQHFDEACEVWN